MAAKSDLISYKLEGLDNYRRQLQGLPDKLRKKALKKPLRAAGNVILKEARARAPVLDPGKAADMPSRRSGTIKRAIKVRVSRLDAKAGNVGVFVNVKPLSKGQISKFKSAAAKAGRRASGGQNPNDPYYWRWLEFGHKIVVRAGGQQGGGVTNYVQRLRNGKLKKRTAKWKASSLTGRRRLSAGNVAAHPFLRPAADKLEEAKRIFEREALPAIAELNKGK